MTGLIGIGTVDSLLFSRCGNSCLPFSPDVFKNFLYFNHALEMWLINIRLENHGRNLLSLWPYLIAERTIKILVF